MTEIIVIGGGAAGLMAAAAAGSAGASVILLERNEKLGKKIYITGKGRCNVTNDCTLDEMLREIPRNPRFLYRALTDFSPQDMMRFLEANGCPVTVQRGRRVFPASEKASDVTRTLERVLQQVHTDVRLHSRVQSLLIEQGTVCGVKLENGRELRADAVILATGGLTAPGTGSTGDGLRMAAETGHTVRKTWPSLSAIETEDEWPKTLQGLALRNVEISLHQGKKTLYRELGEMLFTHFGISGPIVLEMSCHLPETETGIDLAGVQVFLDLKPGLTPEQLDARLQREFAAAPRRQLASVLPALLPASFAARFPSLCGLAPDRICGQITREERGRIAAAFKQLPIALKRLRPIEEAIITRGGVDVREIDPRTMMSRRVNGLYFAGELIDADAHTGGYNLQIAFATGRLAGLSAAGANE